jgi:poly(ribitol-phosphate) beta-N-acetylglucosaminyltransferase
MDNNITSTCFANKDLKDGISVIIPTHKREKIITKCLDSLNKQTLSKSLFEVIIIINGEKDNTKSVINNFSLETGMDNIKVLEIDEGSASLARNEGILYASRKYSVFVDDDDYISENYLEEMYRYADDKTIVISQIVNVNQFGEENRNNTINLQIKLQESKKNYDFTNLDKVSTISACKLIPTSYIKNYQFDGELKSGEDIVFFTELFLNNDFKFKIVPTSKQTIYYRQMIPNSISRQNITFDFFVRQRLEVITRLDKILNKQNDEKKIRFIKSKINAQFLFIENYFLKNPEEKEKIQSEINKYNLSYVPDILGTGIIKKIRFIIRKICRHLVNK